MKHRISFVWIVALAASLLPRPAIAAFHLMEIEQVIGGVNGDTTAQAVQLRCGSAVNNFVGGQVRLVVRDAAGANPVTLVERSRCPIRRTARCAREILSTTAAFNSQDHAGRRARTTRWPRFRPATWPRARSRSRAVAGTRRAVARLLGRRRLHGPQTVDLTNVATDLDAPAFAGALPSGGPQALRFTPACATVSTNTAAQYALTAGAAVFSNNNVTPTAFTVNLPPIPALPGASALLLPALLGLAVLGFAILRRRSA